MFTKLKESKLFKSLSAIFCCDRKCSAKEDAAADSIGAQKTEEEKGDDKAVHPAS